MTQTFRPHGKRWRKATALLLTLCWLTSMTALTGCSAQNLVVVRGDKQITVTAAMIDQLYSDNERLIRAIEQCRPGKP